MSSDRVDINQTDLEDILELCAGVKKGSRSLFEEAHLQDLAAELQPKSIVRLPLLFVPTLAKFEERFVERAQKKEAKIRLRAMKRSIRNAAAELQALDEQLTKDELSAVESNEKADTCVALLWSQVAGRKRKAEIPAGTENA